jgi:hypothetical protein
MIETASSFKKMKPKQRLVKKTRIDKVGYIKKEKE